jgi:5-methylcytosine-specific restriction enzyme A
MLNASRLAEILTDRYGVPVIGSAVDDADGQHARFQPSGIPQTQGFNIAVSIGWRTVEAEFTPATYAKPLLSAMAAAEAEKRTLFQTFVKSALNAGAQVRFQISGNPVDPLRPETWPANWNSMLLHFSKGPMEIDGKNPAAIESLALTWVSRMLGCALSLIPLEPVKQPAGEAEGGAYQATVTRYERSEINRAACIEIHGCRCKACAFEFDKVYGEIGRDFIQVHHVEMVSRLAPGTILDPEIDLVPLCSNCHSMVHRRNPPYTVDELKAFIEGAAKAEKAKA